MWSNFDCKNADKTRDYLERSGSSPINLWLDTANALSPVDPVFQVIPHFVGRLKSLSITGISDHLQSIAAHLTCPAPLLERLEIKCGTPFGSQNYPALTTALFNGELSSLRKLHLQSVCTKLPWRNMVNLTSFTLSHTLPGNLSIIQLLDFFEGAPRLRDVKLNSATPTSSGQDRRLVSLSCLERMDIRGGSFSLLLDHLLIPAGAKLTEWVPSFGPTLEDYLPRSLDNLRNIADFTKVHLGVYDHHKSIQLSGPSGRLRIICPDLYGYRALGCVVRFDASKAELLEVVSTHRFTALPYQGLLHLQNLRVLVFSRCADPYYLVGKLHPNEGSSEAVVCPKLEELVFVLRTDTEEFDTERVIETVAARASRGTKLRTIRIVGGQHRPSPGDLSKLRKHVPQVEYSSEVDVASSDSDDSGEEY